MASAKAQPLLRRLALNVAPPFLAIVSPLLLNSCENGCTTRQPTASDPRQHLRVGGSITCVVCARRRYNDTLLRVRAGEEYRFTAQSPNQWKDWTRVTCANGYPSMFFQKPLESGRVIPNANWFALCGEIQGGEKFVIGSDPVSHTCQSSGSLFLFANDHPWFYCNNFGQIPVSIIRIK
jgi:hypothetical protein